MVFQLRHCSFHTPLLPFLAPSVVSSTSAPAVICKSPVSFGPSQITRFSSLRFFFPAHCSAAISFLAQDVQRQSAASLLSVLYSVPRAIRFNNLLLMPWGMASFFFLSKDQISKGCLRNLHKSLLCTPFFLFFKFPFAVFICHSVLLPVLQTTLP